MSWGCWRRRGGAWSWGSRTPGMGGIPPVHTSNMSPGLALAPESDARAVTPQPPHPERHPKPLPRLRADFGQSFLPPPRDKGVRGTGRVWQPGGTWHGEAGREGGTGWRDPRSAASKHPAVCCSPGSCGDLGVPLPASSGPHKIVCVFSRPAAFWLHRLPGRRSGQEVLSQTRKQGKPT